MNKKAKAFTVPGGSFLILAILLTLLVPSAAALQRQVGDQLEIYTVVVGPGQVDDLLRQGFDVVAVRALSEEEVEADVVLSGRQHAALQGLGLKVGLKLNQEGKSQKQLAAEQSASGYNVWRSWDEPGGIRDELYNINKKYSGFVKLVVLGHTYQGREIIALKVTQGAKGRPDGSRPAVLYSSNQHAREWISVEVNRRLLLWILEQRKLENPDIVDLLKKTELWFVLSANPDGYQYSFDVERLWRKNLRDNDFDGQITNADGVDPNRNWPAHFNYDEEGSSSLFSSQTYRGPAANSEPETQALKGLIDKIKPKFHVNWHSFGEYLLTPVGWQVGTLSADDPIHAALTGTDADPAIPGFDPGPSADELYVTNGETTDYGAQVGTLAHTPELGEGIPGSMFVFPDDEGLIQAEFERTLQYSLDMAKSAIDPDDPVSHLGIQTEPFYLKLNEVDGERTPLAMADLTFDVSYGDPQTVEVLAKRSLGPVTLKYSVNGGATQSAPTSEWSGGERYGQESAKYYHFMQGEVTGTSPGDSVEVWFEGGSAASDSFTYTVASDTGNPVLVMAAEDYTGASPVQGAGPFYLSYYTDALAANGVGFDVYDVDANGRQAPDHLGVLSHYNAVIWYTGNDIITREPGWSGGNASRLAIEEVYEVRAFLNEGGKLFYTGKFAGHQYSPVHGTQLFDPFENQRCLGGPNPVQARCAALQGSGDLTNDFLEYWLGAYFVNDNAGFNPDTGGLFDAFGVADPFTSLSWSFNGADSAQNQDHSASFLATSGILPPGTYPQFTSSAAVKYSRPGGPFEPHTGTYYLYSQIADITYKRLTRTISVPAGGATLSFWVSHDTELHWDHVFVEAHTVGQEDWTTLPDSNGHTSNDTGDSCPAGWRDLHPHLDHYQTLNQDGTCSPTGTTGQWNASSGSSAGWQQWSVDLGAYAGGQVEVSIAYVSDWAVQGLGTFIDDIATSTGEGTTSFEDDGDVMDGWAVTGPPPGSSANPNNFVVTTSAGFPEGAAITTADTVYFGFGFEGITDASTRTTVMGRIMDYLLGP